MIHINKNKNRSFGFLATATLLVAGGTVVKLSVAQTPSSSPGATVPAATDMPALTLPTQPPKGAVVLLGGGDKGAEMLRSGWYRRYSKEPANWSVDRDGVLTPQKSDITSRQEFGDCYLHIEFRPPAAEAGKPASQGNSGIGFQGRYEVQIMSDYGKAPGTHGGASLYSQKAAMVNAARKPGEWQTYDIIFRAPRFDAAGQVTEKPRATVFQNGILVQNNEEFTGMTGIQYGEYKQMAKTGPLVLQGDHDVVQFRNAWIVPLPSRG